MYNLRNNRKDSESSESSCNSNSSSKRRREDPDQNEDTSAKRQQFLKSKRLTSNSKMAPQTMQEQIKLLVEQNERIIKTTSETNSSQSIMQKDIATIKANQMTTTAQVNEMSKEISTLQLQVSSLSAANNTLQQNCLARDIIIFGLPSLKRNEMGQLISSLSTATNTSINMSDFVHIYPLQQKNKDNCTIHAKFYNEQRKNVFIENFKQKKPLLVEDIVQLQPNDTRRGTEIKVRSKLTATNRSILNEARNHKDKIKFAWEKDGRILIRQSDNSRIIEIFSLNQLMEILNPTNGATATNQSENDETEME